jgi:hypothetical protein
MIHEINISCDAPGCTESFICVGGAIDMSREYTEALEDWTIRGVFATFCPKHRLADRAEPYLDKPAAQ